MQMAFSDKLDWDVVSRDLFVKVNGEEIKLHDKKAQLRDDTNQVIGVTGTSYQVFQNSSLKQLITPHIQEGLLTIVNQGVIKNGSRVFIQAQMSDSFNVAGDETKAMITLLNSHDGTCALACGTTAVRVICQNTFASALSELDTKIRHGKNLHLEADNISGITSFINEGMNKYTQAMELLARTKVRDEKVDEIISKVYNKPVISIRAFNTIKSFVRTGIGNEGKTLADVVNGFTQFTSHEMGKDANKRFISSNFGRGAALARRAMNVSLALV